MSLINEYFYVEQKKIIENFCGREDTLDLIILPGISRTGTSVLFQCLNSMRVFLPRMPILLLGTPPTEHNLFRVANWMVSKYLGVESLNPGSNPDKGMSDILIGELTNKPLDKNIKQEMDDFIAGGKPPKWYERFKKRNLHLLTEDGKYFVFGPADPLILNDNSISQGEK